MSDFSTIAALAMQIRTSARLLQVSRCAVITVAVLAAVLLLHSQSAAPRPVDRQRVQSHTAATAPPSLSPWASVVLIIGFNVPYFQNIAYLEALYRPFGFHSIEFYVATHQLALMKDQVHAGH